ncbi:MAG: DNA topoisomerase VI subunit B [Nitrososphaerota archaeon]|nr:DNA topoisomerase VI subunit B [Nitrososphaerota archaeon]MDG6948803.1 DNA topoisomerase VI subunit B [Nitrososphaerota archaeon]
MSSGTDRLKALSPAEWFASNKGLLGFTNLARSLHMTVKEMVDNSLTACEEAGILPEITVEIAALSDKSFRVKVGDNGPGLPESTIVKAFGTFLVSHYSLKQSRSILGVGLKAVILAAQATTATPATIESSLDGKKGISMKLQIDLKKNVADVIARQEVAVPRGMRIEVVTNGDYLRAAKGIKEYLSQTAIIAPYADVRFTEPNGTVTHYSRVIDKLPTAPKEMPPHPHGIDVEMFKSLVRDSKSAPLSSFLRHRFQRVGPKVALEVCGLAGVEPTTKSKALAPEQIRKLIDVMAGYKFVRPDASGLSPVDAESLKVGLEKSMKPEWCETTLRDPSSYSGYPFQVTVGLTFGGESAPAGVSLLRFVNRIPLIHDEAGDVCRKVANQMDWRRYRVDPNNDRIMVAISVVSVKPPYKTASKEVLEDVAELEDEIRLGMQEVGRKLALHLSAREKKESQAKRQQVYDIYVPQALKFLSETAEVPVPRVAKK